MRSTAEKGTKQTSSNAFRDIKFTQNKTHLSASILHGAKIKSANILRGAKIKSRDLNQSLLADVPNTDSTSKYFLDSGFHKKMFPGFRNQDYLKWGDLWPSPFFSMILQASVVFFFGLKYFCSQLLMPVLCLASTTLSRKFIQLWLINFIPLYLSLLSTSPPAAFSSTLYPFNTLLILALITLATCCADLQTLEL